MFPSQSQKTINESRLANDSADDTKDPAVPTMHTISFNHIKSPVNGSGEHNGQAEGSRDYEQQNLESSSNHNYDSNSNNHNTNEHGNAAPTYGESVASSSYFKSPVFSDNSSRISEYGHTPSINPGNAVSNVNRLEPVGGNSALGIVFDRSKNNTHRSENYHSNNESSNEDNSNNNSNNSFKASANQFYKTLQQNPSETSIGTSIQDTFINPISNNSDETPHLSKSLSALTFSPLSSSRSYHHKLNNASNTTSDISKKKEKSGSKVFQKAFKRSRRGSLKKDYEDRVETSDLSDIASIQSNSTTINNNNNSGGSLTRSSTASSLKKMISVGNNSTTNNIVSSSKKLLMNFDFVKPKISSSSIVSSLSPSGSRKSSSELKRTSSNGSTGSLNLASMNTSSSNNAGGNHSIGKRGHYHHHHHHHLLLRSRKEAIANVASSSSSNSKVSDIPMLYNFNSSAVHSNNNELIRAVTQIENEVLSERRITEEKQKDLIDRLLNLLYSHTLVIFKGENLSVPLEDLTKLTEVYILVRSLKKSAMKGSASSSGLNNTNLSGYPVAGKNSSVNSFGNNDAYNDTYGTITASLNSSGPSGSSNNMNEAITGDNISTSGASSFTDHRSRSGSSSQHSKSSGGAVSGSRTNGGGSSTGINNLEVHNEEEEEEDENASAHEVALKITREFSEFLKVGVSLMENQSNIYKITKFENSKFNKFDKFERQLKKDEGDGYGSDYGDDEFNEYDKDLKMQEMEMNGVASLWDFYLRNVISYLEMIFMPVQMYFNEIEMKLGMSSNGGAATAAATGATSTGGAIPATPTKTFEQDIGIDLSGTGNVTSAGATGGNSSGSGGSGDFEQWTVKKMLLIVFRDMIIIPRTERIGGVEYLYHNRSSDKYKLSSGHYNGKRSSSTSGNNEKNEESSTTTGTINSDDNVERCLLQCFGLVATIRSRDYKQKIVNDLFVAMKYYK